MPWFTNCLQLNMTYKFSWFNKNNSSTIKDMKNLYTIMNYTGLMTAKTKHSFLVSSYSMVKYDTLVPNILNTPIVIVLKHQFLNWS